MADYNDYVLYDGVTEDMEDVKNLTKGSEDWKRVQDSIDKRYNTTLAEARLGAELSEKEARIELERMKIEKELELNERRLADELADRKARLELDKKKAEREADIAEERLVQEFSDKSEKLIFEKEKARMESDIRKYEAEVADKKSKREFIGKLAGIGAGIMIVFGKIIYDNSEAITDKFTLDAGSKMINNK